MAAAWKIEETQDGQVIQHRRVSLVGFFKKVFLPLGFPHSVHPGYLRYQFYDSLQGYCSYVRGVTCLQHVLQAAGVGDASRTPYQAAILWIFQEGFAIIFGLLFAGLLAPHLDVHVQLFRFLADVMNNIGLTLDMCTAYVPQSMLLYLVSVSSVSKSLCGLFAGATKAHITAHFAKYSLADVHAKEGTQESLVHLLGMVSGVLFGRFSEAKWTLFTILTLLHIWSNYQAVSCLRLRTLNYARAKKALQPVLENGDVSKVLVPDQVEESLSDAFMVFILGKPDRVKFGVPLQRIVDIDPSVLPTKRNFVVIEHDNSVLVSLLEGATNQDEILAVYEALALLQNRSGARIQDGEQLVSALKAKGWETETLHFGFGTTRNRYSRDKKGD